MAFRDREGYGAMRTIATALSLFALATATPMNISISSQSPTIYYSPPAVGPRFANGSTEGGTRAAGWQILYGGSNNTAWTPGAVGRDGAIHSSWGTGASASFGFKGTAIWLYGSGTAAACSITLNGEAGRMTNDTSGVLGWATGLADQWWDVGLNVTDENGCQFTGITFTVNIGADNADLSSKDVPALGGSQTAPNPDLSFSGQWTSRTDAGSGDTYPRIDTSVGNARAVLPQMRGETFVMISGSVNYDHGAFRVESTDPSDGWPAWTAPQGSSPWWVYDQVLFFGLVKGGAVSIQNLVDGRWLDFSKMTIITPSTESGGGGGNGNGTGDGGDEGNKGDDGVPIGAIVGGVVGGLAAIIIGIILWILWRRVTKHSPDYYQPHQVETSSPGEIDPYTSEAHTSPISRTSFHSATPQMAYANAASGSSGSEYGLKPVSSQGHGHSHNDLLSRGSSSDMLSPDPHGGSQNRSEPSSGQNSPLMLVDPVSFPTPVMPAAASSNAKRPRRQSNQSGVRQETDAGSVSVIPPSYDPSWAPPTQVNTTPHPPNQPSDTRAPRT